MSETKWNIPLPVQNSQRRYPLAADTTATDSSDSFKLPNDFLVGLHFPTHAGLGVDPTRFYVKSIGAYDSGFAIIVGYSTDINGAEFTPGLGAETDAATVWINRSSHTRNQTYRVGGIGVFYDVSGTVTVGRFDDIDSQPSGDFNFTLEATRLSPDVVRPVVRGVSSISILEDNETIGPFYGDIELIPEDNMQITASQNASGVTEIRFSAIAGEGLGVNCDVPEDSPCIRRLNGVGATASGDFILLGSQCVGIEAVSNGIRIRDTCSSPCCGCDELEEISQDLRELQSNSLTLGNFVSNLDTRVTQMDTIVLGARLSDRGCNNAEGS